MGWNDGEYVLTIDDQEIGTFTDEQLAEGVNLAVLATPMSRQAETVHQLTKRHNDLHFFRWRQIQVPYQKENLPHLDEALQALDKLEADVVAQQRAAAEPKSHRYQIRPKS